jgi:hypothetical protein
LALLGATQEELLEEMANAVDRGDKFRLECVRELYDANVKLVWHIHTDWENKRRELRIVPALPIDDMTPIATYPLPWDEWLGGPLTEAIERAKREHGAW